MESGGRQTGFPKTPGVIAGKTEAPIRPDKAEPQTGVE